MSTPGIDLNDYYRLTGLNNIVFPELTDSTNPEQAEEFMKAIKLLHYSPITVINDDSAIKETVVNINSSLSHLVDSDYNFCCTDEEILYIIKLYNVIDKIPKYRVFLQREMYFILIYFLYTFRYVNINRFIDNINEKLFKHYINEEHWLLAQTLLFELAYGQLNVKVKDVKGVKDVSVSKLIMIEILRRPLPKQDGGNSKIVPNRGAIQLYKRKSKKLRKSKKSKKSRKHRAKN
jgi:hypothetical protein